jgi:N-hydroxyarylamine O-acetyltransferase
MDDLHLEAYLGRIGYHGPREPSLHTLAALHEAHVGAIPFENLDVLLGRPILLDLPAVQAKLVEGRRGGYCFEQNTLFRAVLERLGYTVTPLAGRVRTGPPGPVRPRTHMTLVVDVSGEPFLSDVGFGGDGPLRPVPLREGAEAGTGDDGCRLGREGELWVLQGRTGGHWTDLYAFTLEPQFPADYEMANHFTSTYPRSPFVTNLVAQRSWRDKRVILRNRDLTVRQRGATETSTIRDPDHLLEVLAREFGLLFPTGTRFSQPEF